MSQRIVEVSQVEEMLIQYLLYAFDLPAMREQLKQLVHLGEVSAATGEGVHEAMAHLVKLCIAKIASYEIVKDILNE